MGTIATFVGFVAAFLAGTVLVIVGAAGSQWVDCPAAVVEFPAAAIRCNLFSSFVYGGGLVALVGVTGFSWMGISGRLPD